MWISIERKLENLCLDHWPGLSDFKLSCCCCYLFCCLLICLHHWRGENHCYRSVLVQKHYVTIFNTHYLTVCLNQQSSPSLWHQCESFLKYLSSSAHVKEAKRYQPFVPTILWASALGQALHFTYTKSVKSPCKLEKYISLSPALEESMEHQRDLVSSSESNGQ